jgi:hypothetical protein
MILNKVFFLKIKVQLYLEIKFKMRAKLFLMIYLKTKNPFLACRKLNNLN